MILELDAITTHHPMMTCIPWSSVLPSIHKACRPNKPSIDFSLMWEWGGCKSFDIVIGSIQIMPSHHALNFAWGEHCYHVNSKLLNKIVAKYHKLSQIIYSPCQLWNTQTLLTTYVHKYSYNTKVTQFRHHKGPCYMYTYGHSEYLKYIGKA